MATKYAPNHLIHLLTVAAWKAETTLDYTGFRYLAEELSGLTESHVDTNQKYLSDLYNDAVKQQKNGELLGKRESHINPILNYLGFKSWQAFEHVLIQFNRFADPSKFDPSSFSSNDLLFLCSNSIHSRLEEGLAYVKKSSKTSISIHRSPTRTTDELFAEIQELLTQVPFVIWCISDEWNALEIDNTQLNPLIESGQLIPIRVDTDFTKQTLPISFLTDYSIPSGTIGLYMAIAIIQCKSLGPSAISAKSNHGQGRNYFNEIKGNVNQIESQTIHGSTFTIGGTINQNFTKNQDH